MALSVCIFGCMSPSYQASYVYYVYDYLNEPCNLPDCWRFLFMKFVYKKLILIYYCHFLHDDNIMLIFLSMYTLFRMLLFGSMVLENDIEDSVEFDSLQVGFVWWLRQVSFKIVCLFYFVVFFMHFFWLEETLMLFPFKCDGFSVCHVTIMSWSHLWMEYVYDDWLLNLYI